MSSWPQKFLSAFNARHPYDSISAQESSLSIGDAYDIQHQFVSLRQEHIRGYKAALTALPAQQAMNIHLPIIGVLFDSGEFAIERRLQLTQAALLETEIGFVTATSIRSPVTATDVFNLMSGCMAMIEIASPNLHDRPNGLDLIATNAASYGYICSPLQSLEMASDDLPVTLTREGKIQLTGVSGEVLGGQQDALAWLINQVLLRGYTIEPGHLLMTGSIGGMCPAASGHYQADFGALGALNFSVAAAPAST